MEGKGGWELCAPGRVMWTSRLPPPTCFPWMEEAGRLPAQASSEKKEARLGRFLKNQLQACRNGKLKPELEERLRGIGCRFTEACIEQLERADNS